VQILGLTYTGNDPHGFIVGIVALPNGLSFDTASALDNDAPVFSISPVIVSEGGKAFFTVTRSGDSAVSQSVDVSTSIAQGDTAEADDFTAVTNQTLTFAASETTKTFYVQTTQDSPYEGLETFSVSLSNATNGALISPTNGTAKGTIADDGTGPDPDGDGPLQPDDDRPLTVNNIILNEGSSHAIFNVAGFSGQLVRLSLSGDTATIATSQLPPLDGSEDFGPGLEYWDGNSWNPYIADSFVPIPTGSNELLVRTPIVNDTLEEGNHSFNLIATNTGGSSVTGQATINDRGTGTLYTDGAPSTDGNGNPVAPVDTITKKDDDRSPSPTVSIGGGNVVERNIANGVAEIRYLNISINLSGPASQDTVINYRLRAATEAEVAGRFGVNKPAELLGIATPLVDFNGFGNVGTEAALSGSLTLRAGFTSMLLEIPVIGDNNDERDESFFIELTGVSGGNGATINNQAAKAEIIIIDNDTNPNQTIDYSQSDSFVDARGGAGNDTISGSRFNDLLYGYDGTDVLTGLAGSDLLTGGNGADQFRYTAISDSAGSTIDTIRDFVPNEDRILFADAAATAVNSAGGANGKPSALYNASTYNATTTPTNFTTAITAAFADKDPTQAGKQSLLAGEAVIFTQAVKQGSRTTYSSYLAVNLGSNAYEAGTDFLVNITGWRLTGVSQGQLDANQYFA